MFSAFHFIPCYLSCSFFQQLFMIIFASIPVVSCLVKYHTRSPSYPLYSISNHGIFLNVFPQLFECDHPLLQNLQLSSYFWQTDEPSFFVFLLIWHNAISIPFQVRGIMPCPRLSVIHISFHLIHGKLYSFSPHRYVCDHPQPLRFTN